MTNTQNPAPDWGGDAPEWQQQPGPGQPFPGGYQQAPGSAAPQYGPGYQQPAPSYQQAPWQGAIGAADPDLPGSGDTGHALLLPSDRHRGDRLRDPGFVEARRWRLHRRRSGFEAGTYVDNRQPGCRGSGHCHRGDCRRGKQWQQQQHYYG